MPLVRRTLPAAGGHEFWHAGRQVRLTLSGPAGADDADPWNLVSDSLRWRR
jgi:hypothetical protein